MFFVFIDCELRKNVYACIYTYYYSNVRSLLNAEGLRFDSPLGQNFFSEQPALEPTQSQKWVPRVSLGK